MKSALSKMIRAFAFVAVVSVSTISTASAGCYTGRDSSGNIIYSICENPDTHQISSCDRPNGQSNAWVCHHYYAYPLLEE